MRTEPKTKQDLLDAIQDALRLKPSTEDVRRQRISFVTSSLKEHSSTTRAVVEKVLAEQEGEK